MEPMVARWGTQHPSAPLVVALHGNGTSEHSLIEMSPWLPHGPVAYASVRGRLQRDKGWSWYEGDDPGAGGLAETVSWLLGWLDTEGDPDRPVLLLGFREGVTAAGALMLSAPERFSGAVLLYGAILLDPAPARGHLAGMPVFLAHGTDDPRTPAAALHSTWHWLTACSGAPVWAERGPGGAQLAGEVVGHVTTWLADRLDHLRTHGENPLPDGAEPTWDGQRLPPRAGDPPLVSTGVPQHQLVAEAAEPGGSAHDGTGSAEAGHRAGDEERRDGPPGPGHHGPAPDRPVRDRTGPAEPVRDRAGPAEPVRDGARSGGPVHRGPGPYGPVSGRASSSDRTAGPDADAGGGADVAQALWARLAGLAGVTTAPATIGPDGTRSLLVDRAQSTGPDRAFLLPDVGEFAHQHPGGDLHVVLPDELAYDALAKGWAVAHPLAGLRVSPGAVLVPAPRDAGELDVVTVIARASYRYAIGG